MTPSFGLTISADADAEVRIEVEYLQSGNTYDKANLFDILPVVRRSFYGTKRLQSDGLRGVVADNTPTEAEVVIVQEVAGLLVETARTVTEDGSWSVSGLPDAKAHAVAFKEGFNAGITSGIQPED